MRRVLDGETLSAALAAVATDQSDAGRRRSLVQELAYGTLRHWGTLDALTKRLAAKPFSDPALATLVAVALYQLGYTRAPAFAIVDRAVASAAVLVRPAAKALVNALLRRYLRERRALDAAVRADPVARFSYPSWWIERVHIDFGDEYEAILDAGNARPPLTLRVNARITTRDRYLDACAQAGVGAHAAGADGVIVETPKPVTQLPGYADGAFAVQDLGAQCAAGLLDARAGHRVLDACAAPGGKTAHIAQTPGIEIDALDCDESRLARVRDNLARLRVAGGNVRVIAGDAAEPRGWWDGRPYERILADVPCTASGVVRRHPDGKWLRRESDVAAFARMQARIIDAMWSLLAPGGRLLYVTCSIFREENDAQVDAFCARHADALREILTFPPGAAHRGGQLLPSPPAASHNQDGFFYARLAKA